MTIPAVLVQDLVYEYPLKRALHGISCEIPAGSVTALVGPNGAGKTTLMRCIAALDSPYAGSVQIFGVDTAAHPRRAHQLIGYLSDFFGLYEDLTVEQSLLHIGMLQGLTNTLLKNRAEEVAAILGLGDRMNEPVANLSRGLKQRVGIAQTLLHRPKLLILDEPAAGLDPEARHALSGLIRSLASSGMTILVSSHILSELEDYCTSMLTVQDGRIAGHSAVISQDAGHSSLVVMIAVAEAPDRTMELLQSNPSVRSVSLKNGEIEVVFGETDGDEDVRVLSSLITQGVPVREYYRFRESLQEVYLTHVKGGRDER